MLVKITTFQQINSLQEGDVLQKFPASGRPEHKFDKTRTEDIVTYEIKTINRISQTIHLAVNENSELFSWPMSKRPVY
jgi:hypothetical protein